MLARLRSQAWIVRGHSLAVQLDHECLLCTAKKVHVEQKMGDLPPERTLTGCPPWTNVHLDLAGPMVCKSMVQSRTTMKVWLLIIFCANTGATHIKVMHSYGTQAYLLQW